MDEFTDNFINRLFRFSEQNISQENIKKLDDFKQEYERLKYFEEIYSCQCNPYDRPETPINISFEEMSESKENIEQPSKMKGGVNRNYYTESGNSEEDIDLFDNSSSENPMDHESEESESDDENIATENLNTENRVTRKLGKAHHMTVKRIGRELKIKGNDKLNKNEIMERIKANKKFQHQALNILDPKNESDHQEVIFSHKRIIKEKPRKKSSMSKTSNAKRQMSKTNRNVKKKKPKTR
jgi:hypothetical protein